MQLFGASTQIALHKGMPVRSSIDYRLYKNNNERVSGLFNPVTYPGGVSWRAMAEFTAMGETANLAARLQAMAEPGTVLIAQDTYDLVKHAFETVPLGARAV